ncbi:phosphoribosyltransferase family protein [Limosilactobacillus fermentum]|uniref:phosphoribosyltransferase family protein n=1 Tax=Limosilactobacillus fermentum TaxID=1613 RepID=UPI00257023C1|nr:phosphoribosyltransferase family protein [Limosilactobacillus fermentum]WJD85690.1 phosphoribosyltransferase family protein [Limosilactobacillus fermentum]
MLNYPLQIGKLQRQLPLIDLNSELKIASFVILGDAELTREAARLLAPLLPTDFDALVTMESKGIPLAHELALLTKHPRYFVIRKGVKAYMHNPYVPYVTTVQAITTSEPQQLVLDGADAHALKGQRVILVDDVISTGGSLKAGAQLLKECGATVITQAAILAEGDAVNRTDITYLKPLPLFNKKGEAL